MTLDAAIYCHADLNYASEGGQVIPVRTAIGDGRHASHDLEFAHCGFALRAHASAVTDWVDEAHVNLVHRPEIRDLAGALTGAEVVIPYPALIRSPRTAASEADYAPIEFVHSDFTEDYRSMVRHADRAYREFIDPLLDEAGIGREALVDAARIQMIQFWRNVGALRPDRPLALCDARSVPRDALDAYLVPEYAGRRLEFETFGVRPPHQPDDYDWYTFPDMRADEVLVLRTYDSALADRGEAFWTPHSAFVDPRAGSDAAKRESVEMRALCLHW